MYFENPNISNSSSHQGSTDRIWREDKPVGESCQSGHGPHFHSISKEKTKTAVTKPALSFVTFGSFAAMEQAHQLNFLVNDMLAFLNFPIRLNESNTANLKGLYDTGGCCNMGKKDYHLSIAKQHPHLVKQIFDLQKIRYAPIKIGGIKDSVEIDVIIKYFIPFENGQGENHTLMIGLTDDLPINTLCGLPFILKAKLVAQFYRNAVISNFFNQEFDLTLECPRLLPTEHVERNQSSDRKVFSVRFDTTAENL
ncbi:unnamed protein product [Cylindrotheca closterium]|uniref:Uncharacterized protein n=1 Tax=Cylindrotheca closterium TaxID=2856 RepID=A0AAD2FKB2_9STRA|nr:unnamed protein product [Cylindrotheca closterium]